MSHMAVVGLLIVSSHSSRVRSPMAASTAAASVVSTAVTPMPERDSTAWARPDHSAVHRPRNDDLLA